LKREERSPELGICFQKKEKKKSLSFSCCTQVTGACVKVWFFFLKPRGSQPLTGSSPVRELERIRIQYFGIRDILEDFTGVAFEIRNSPNSTWAAGPCGDTEEKRFIKKKIYIYIYIYIYIFFFIISYLKSQKYHSLTHFFCLSPYKEIC
jgi:hypothetical protein